MSISGKTLTVKVGSTPVVITGNHAWTADGKVDELDATTGADAGFDHPDSGVKSQSFTINGYFDLTSLIGVDIQEGTVLTDLKLYRAIGDSIPARTYPTALVLTFQERGEVKGRLEWTCTGKSVGSYTVGGLVSPPPPPP